MTERNRASTEEDQTLETIFANSPLDFGDTDFCQTLVENTSEGLLTIDKDSTIVFANPALERILGHRPEDLVGQSLLTLIPDRLVQDHVRTFQRYLETGEPQIDWDGIDLPAQHEDGHEIPVSISFREHFHEGQQLFTGVLRDISDHKSRQTDLERLEDIVTHLPDGIYRTESEPGGTFLEANPALRDMLDVESIDALRQMGPADFYANPDKQRSLREQIREEGVLSDEELKIRTATGGLLWTSVTAIEREEQGETYIDGVVRDITERKEREHELREHQQSIDAILSHIPGILFTLDEDGVFTRSEGETLRNIGLEPEEAVGQSVFDLYADHPKILDLCRRALEGEALNTTVEVAGRVFEATCQPVFDEEDTVTQVVGFAYDVTERQERERTLENQRTTLERVQQITESLRPLNRALAQATTRDDVNQVVCEQLAASDAYLFAWYGDYTPGNTQVSPQEWAGVDDDYLRDVEVTIDGSDTGQGPVGRAIRSCDVQAARNILTDPSFELGRDEALDRGYQSSAVIPVVFGKTVYGVIGVYSGRPNAFDEYEQGLLRELGDRIGHAIHAEENKRLLHTETVVELEFRTTGTGSVFVQLTEELDCRLELETVAPASKNTFLCYATTEGATPNTVIESLSDSPVIAHARVVDATDSSGTIEYRIRKSPMTKLLNYGAVVTSQIVENGEETIVVEVAPDADIRTIISAIQTTYSNTVFVAKRSVDRPVQSVTVPHNGLQDVLTERQREVLELAYHAGFFESPRQSTGDELAHALGITPPTFYVHIRKATQKLLEQIDEMDLFE